MRSLLPEGRGQAAPWKRTVVTLIALLSLGSVTACGDEQPYLPVNPETQSFRDVGVDQSAAALVPAAIRDTGKLVIPTAATYPPNEFLAADGKTIIGMDADLARAIAQRLGLELELEAKDFDSIFPAIVSGDYKLVLSSITVTPERTKGFDMVTYFEAGTGFFTANEEPLSLSGLADLCGHSVAVAQRTVQQADAKAQNKKCRASGKSPVAVRTYPNQTQATESVRSATNEFGMADTPVTSYIVKKSGGRLVKVGEDYGVAPYGVVVNRASGLAPAVKSALDSLVTDGAYKEILERWGLEDYAIKRPTIEP